MISREHIRGRYKGCTQSVRFREEERCCVCELLLCIERQVLVGSGCMAAERFTAAHVHIGACMSVHLLHVLAWRLRSVWHITTTAAGFFAGALFDVLRYSLLHACTLLVAWLGSTAGRWPFI